MQCQAAEKLARSLVNTIPCTQVFVRIRPSATKDAPRWDSENCIHATSRCSIAIAPPEASQAYKNGDRGQTYSFTRVFDEATPQQDYFDNTAAPLVSVQGRSCSTAGTYQ